MKKLKLDLDNLQVDSFDTTPLSLGHRGTIFGQASADVTDCNQGQCSNGCATTDTNEYPTCGELTTIFTTGGDTGGGQGPTAANTCPNTCANTCAATCQTCGCPTNDHSCIATCFEGDTCVEPCLVSAMCEPW